MRILRTGPSHLAAHVQRMGYTQRFHELQELQRRHPPVRRYERRGFRWSFGPQYVKR